MVSVSKGNSKLGGIMSVSLPRCTCRHDAPCYKDGCYCAKGNFVFKNVQNSYENNLNIWLTNPQQYEDDILNQLPFRGIFRWSVCGDIPNASYLEMIVRIAKKVKEVKFLCFTKKYDIVNKFLDSGNKIPSNLRVVFSGWKGLELVNPHSLPVAWMYDKKDPDERIPKTAMLCGGHCETCGLCWNLKRKQNVYFNKH